MAIACILIILNVEDFYIYHNFNSVNKYWNVQRKIHTLLFRQSFHWFVRSFVCSTLGLPRHFSCKRLFLIFFLQHNATQRNMYWTSSKCCFNLFHIEHLIRLVAIQRRKLHIKQKAAILIYVRNYRTCTNVVGQKAHVYFRIFFRFHDAAFANARTN